MTGMLFKWVDISSNYARNVPYGYRAFISPLLCEWWFRIIWVDIWMRYSGNQIVTKTLWVTKWEAMSNKLPNRVHNSPASWSRVWANKKLQVVIISGPIQFNQSWAYLRFHRQELILVSVLWPCWCKIKWLSTSYSTFAILHPNSEPSCLSPK